MTTPQDGTPLDPDTELSGGGPQGTTSQSQQKIAAEGSGGEKDPAEDAQASEDTE